MSPVKSKIDTYDYVFPVFDESSVNIFGSSFHMGRGLFATAGHVITNSVESGGPRIAVPDKESRNLRFHKPDFFMVDATRDVGLMMIEKLQSTACFSLGIIQDDSSPTMGRDVITYGYPFALAPNGQIQIRLFKGHIVSVTNKYELPAKPGIYELSFQAPKGLSGAPLLLDFGIGVPDTVAGIIFETAIKTVDYPDKEEEIDEGHKKITVSYKYFLNLAEAILINELRDMRIGELGKTVREYLSG